MDRSTEVKSCMGKTKTWFIKTSLTWKNGAMRGSQEALKGPKMIWQKRHLRGGEKKTENAILLFYIFSKYILD